MRPIAVLAGVVLFILAIGVVVVAGPLDMGPPRAVLSVNVRDSTTQFLVPGANLLIVSDTGVHLDEVTGVAGGWSAYVDRPANYTITASKAGYKSQTGSVFVPVPEYDGQGKTITLTISPAGSPIPGGSKVTNTTTNTTIDDDVRNGITPRLLPIEIELFLVLVLVIVGAVAIVIGFKT